ncbi:hypothetical protein BDN72DRAFT_893839 [Pluteus cervinus]|uniref:Uncharacterized protein n=1 Tax=Pluteus cervinus TaxID=181527 RepID=A0ACD3B7K1_9AGAR|nr:hypothetical protein BDN72DRAFT_893839 [Pluteus cervinus]
MHTTHPAADAESDSQLTRTRQDHIERAYAQSQPLPTGLKSPGGQSQGLTRSYSQPTHPQTIPRGHFTPLNGLANYGSDAEESSPANSDNYLPPESEDSDDSSLPDPDFENDDDDTHLNERFRQRHPSSDSFVVSDADDDDDGATHTRKKAAVSRKRVTKGRKAALERQPAEKGKKRKAPSGPFAAKKKIKVAVTKKPRNLKGKERADDDNPAMRADWQQPTFSLATRTSQARVTGETVPFELDRPESALSQQGVPPVAIADIPKATKTVYPPRTRPVALRPLPIPQPQQQSSQAPETELAGPSVPIANAKAIYPRQTHPTSRALPIPPQQQPSQGSSQMYARQAAPPIPTARLRKPVQPLLPIHNAQDDHLATPSRGKHTHLATPPHTNPRQASSQPLAVSGSSGPRVPTNPRQASSQPLTASGSSGPRVPTTTSRPTGPRMPTSAHVPAPVQLNAQDLRLRHYYVHDYEEQTNETFEQAAGGFMSDEEQMLDMQERDGLQGPQLAAHFTPDLTVTDMHKAGRARNRVPQPSSSKRAGPVRPNFKHFLKPIVDEFKKAELRLFNDLALRDSWDRPDEETLAQMWNDTEGEQWPVQTSLTASGESGDYERWSWAKGLLARVITQWTAKIGDRGLSAVEAEIRMRFGEPEDQDVEKVADWVRFMLGPSDDLSCPDRPFLWQSRDLPHHEDEVAYEINEAGEEVEVMEGLFYGCLVARTLARHLDFLARSIEPDDDFEPTSQPRGALMMSIHSVHRALLFWRSGRLMTPSSVSEASFSKKNWGDALTPTVVKGERCMELTPRGTVFKATIDALTQEQWVAILDAAKSYTRGAGVIRSGVAHEIKVITAPPVILSDRRHNAQ